MSMSLPVCLPFIDGVSCPTGQQDIPLVAPETGATIGALREAGAEGVAAAVASARAAFAAVRLAPTHQRIAWLQACARALSGAAEEIAQIICEDVGKPIRVARFEV